MQGEKNNITVAIRCLVYNHEKYLRDCLDGIVMQQTDFCYFAVVHDDCSTDGSIDIIREYALKYPDKIHPIYEDFNCYSRDWKIADTKIHAAYNHATYVAVCEGDDFWTDPLKLQKQVDFMESHGDYAICAHETRIVDEREKKSNDKLYSQITDNLFVPTNKSDYTFKETLTGNIFHLSSMLYRNYPEIHLPDWRYRISAGDMVYFRYLGAFGKTHWMSDVMSAYRFHSNSLTSSENVYLSVISFNNLNIKVLRLLNRFWNRKYQSLIYPIISRYYMRSMFVCLSKSGRNYPMAREMAKKARMYDMKTFWKYLFVESWEKLKKHL